MGECMKIFAVSDVHGHCTLLREALNEAGYDGENPHHLLVCCGDYFDRGKENVEVLKFFERQKNCVKLKGNHEEMFKKLLNDGKILSHHYSNGTIQTILDFFGPYAIDPVTDIIDFSGKTGTVDRLCDFIDETVDYFETKNYIFVHGWLPEVGADRDWHDATPEQWHDARWAKWTSKYMRRRPHPDKTLVCGHVPTLYAYVHDNARSPVSSSIFYRDGLIAIDAGTVSSGRVNVLVIEDELI